jgi:hypothetical protein
MNIIAFLLFNLATNYSARRHTPCPTVAPKNFIAKIKIDPAVSSDMADKAGYGKIFVMPMEQAVRIRTGESGPDTIKIITLAVNGKAAGK